MTASRRPGRASLHLCVVAWLWPLALSALATTRVHALDLGPQTQDCRSALILGPTRCASLLPSVGAAVRAPGIASVQGSITSQDVHATNQPTMDTRIDRFLANYGKPPRAAVRALLEPSDDNIRLMLHEQEVILKNAAYVADRLNALREAEAAARIQTSNLPRTAASPPTLAALMQVRTRFFGKAEAPVCSRFASLAEPLLQRLPDLDLRVVLTGQPDAARLHDCLDRLPLSIAVSLAPQANAAEAETSGANAAVLADTASTPIVQIERGNGKVVSLPAFDIDAAHVLAAMIRLAHDRIAPPESSLP